MTWRRPSSLENSKSFLIRLRMVTQQVNVITAFSQSKIIKFLRLYNVRVQTDPLRKPTALFLRIVKMAYTAAKFSHFHFG